MRVEITQEEFNTRKSNGTIFICRSCLDNKKKYVMIGFENKGKGFRYHFCESCLTMMGECIPCAAAAKQK